MLFNAFYKNFIFKFPKLIFCLLLTIVILSLSIIYLSTIGLETDKFNNQIKNEIYKSNNSLDIELKKVKLRLDPINFKFNIKT